MSLAVGINATGGQCLGYITPRTTFAADSNGNFSFDILVSNFTCDYISGSGTLYYKNKSTGAWVVSSTFSGSGYGYIYWNYHMNGWIGSFDFKVEFSTDIVLFSSSGSCIPTWQCEQPLNSYENDGCNNRRYNSLCVPTIAISPSSAMVGIGTTRQLGAICKNINNNVVTCPTLVWTSNNPSIATVNPSTGLVSAMTLGTTGISCSGGGSTSNISTITVYTSVLTTIEISPISVSINVGATQQLTAICKDQNTNVMSCPTLTWSSNDTSKANVSSSGLVTGIATGSANVTVSHSTITSNISEITVLPTGPIIASNTVRYSSDSEISTSEYSSLTLLKSITITNDYTGSWRIVFDLDGDLDQYDRPVPNYGRLYKNGVAYGTLRNNSSGINNYITFSEDFNNINIPHGTVIQLYAQSNMDGYIPEGCGCAKVRNFRIEFDSLGAQSDICSWISSRGWNNVSTFDIMTLVSAYLLQTNLGFTVTSAHIMGTVAYHIGNISSGNSLTGCSFI